MKPRPDTEQGFQQIETPRLVIRRFRERDAPELSAYRSDPQVARYQSWTDLSPQAALDFIGSLQASEPGTAGEWFQFAVQFKASAALIGDIGLRTDQHEPAVGEIGFTLARPFQGQGYAREAVQAVLDYCFETLNMHRIIALTDTRNQASIRLLERLGFRQEAHFVQSYREGEIWTDEYQYAILRSEWGPG